MKTKDLKEFISGKWVQRYEYKSFSPENINYQWKISDPNIQFLLSEADREVGRLDAFSTLVPNVDYFIKMHITKEATVSSKIEGTQTSFQEALIKEENIKYEKREDWKEVHNYIDAINQAINDMDKLPISSRLIKKTHKTLLTGVRGYAKLPGEYRNSQNWIGGASLKNAVFVSPLHDEIPDLMSDLESFINSDLMYSDTQVPHLIKIAIIHYQFETIHPFLDGNGRIGRLLITLYLINKQLLKYPTLYLSKYFEENKFDYYDKLMLVRMNNNLSDWIAFFLEGVIETAKSSAQTFENILKLRENIERKYLSNFGKNQALALELVNHLYKNPIMDGVQIAKTLDVHPSTANRMIKDFESMGILEELTGYKRNKNYAFAPYIRLFTN